MINRDEESSQAYAPNASPPKDASPSHTTAAAPHTVPASPPTSASPPASAQYSNQEVSGFDEFDPRGSFSGKDVAILGTVHHDLISYLLVPGLCCMIERIDGARACLLCDLLDHIGIIIHCLPIYLVVQLRGKILGSLD